MMEHRDLTLAKELLAEGEYTCVLCREGETFTSCLRGVKPLLDWLEEGDIPAGCAAADRVVGRAAAFLYVLLGVGEVYAGVMSVLAKEVLEQHGIACGWGELVPAIRNRAGDGFCPMESAVRETEEPAEALTRIRETLETLKK